MKLYEIENFLDKKVRCADWFALDYIAFDKRLGCWRWNNSGDEFIMRGEIGEARWEEYVEPKKRYWLWRVDIGYGWYKNTKYYDDNGVNTHGLLWDNTGTKMWADIKKIKIEGDFIDI